MTIITPPTSGNIATSPLDPSNSSPTLVSDNFHFSQYYWRSWDLSGAAVSEEAASVGEHGNDSGNESDTDFYKPHPVTSEDIRLKFYHSVMGDGSNNIHFGKWDGIPVDSPDAYGKAGQQMTDFMFDLALTLQPHLSNKKVEYVDLGSGTGASVVRNAQRYSNVYAHCLNLCHEQNITAEELAKENELTDRIVIDEGAFEDAPYKDHLFDLVFSQDAFIHARSKKQVYQEAYRITKPGGALVFCDIMAGGKPDLIDAELSKFMQTNVINDWLSPAENVACLEAIGYKEVKAIDVTQDMRTSFHMMLKKVNFMLEHGHVGSNLDKVWLRQYAMKIKERLVQIDRGVFGWCVMHARKPVVLELQCKPPVPFVNTSPLIISENAKEPTDIVVVDILHKMPREKVMALPSTVKLMITLSAGLDHIDTHACRERGITVMQSGRDAITEHVVHYGLALMILGLRDAFNQLGVSFPSSGWNLNWNCEGVSITEANIAIVGMGVIAKQLIKQVRVLAPKANIMYYVPEHFRDHKAEADYSLMYYDNVETMAAKCDALVPVCPLTKDTEHLISEKVLSVMPEHAGLINFARGKVVDTDALTKVMEARKLKYALLDTTFPEPLPSDHALWKMDNVYILPHFATNTMTVRKALVEEIQPIVEEFYGLGSSEAKLRQQELELRQDLAVAHRLTAEMGMDMLVWNHISARFRDGCLITPGRKLWSQIGPQDLVYSSSNVTADIIHDAVYSARPDVKAIIHLHTPAAVAISCLQEGFIPMTQDAAYFYQKVANYEWDGVSDDVSEGPMIAQAVKRLPGCNTLLMQNHGFVCFGSSVKEAWVLAYYFERCCEVQLRVMQSGGKPRIPNPRIMAQAAKTSYLPEFAPGVCEWESLCKSISLEDSRQ